MKQNVTTKFKRGKKAKVTHDEAVQGANLASGMPAEPEHIEKVVEFTPEEKQEFVENVLGENDLTEKEAERLEEQEAFENAVDQAADNAAAEGDEIAAIEEELAEEKVVNSIVKPKYKDKYIENAKAVGAKGKAARRSNWDWLSQMLATYCLSDKGKIDIGAFTDVLDANGVDHSKWLNRTKGWEGRFRMTGRVALQRKVADSGRLVWPDGTELVVPVDFVEKFKSKA